MKTYPLLAMVALAASSLLAHDHIEIGIDPENPDQLGFDGAFFQRALLVPVGEPFSSYAPAFPGGYYANELTFTTETNALDPAVGANPIVEILSVVGPSGGIFSFWEVGQTSPSWSLPVGWTSDSPSIPAVIGVILGGDNHVHGRIFTSNKPGSYTINYRVRDDSSAYEPSDARVLTFQADDPPRLEISTQSGNVVISFLGRLNLSYDLQSSTTLAPGSWATVEGLEPVSGNGTVVETQDPLNGRSKVFYRLVEYQ